MQTLYVSYCELDNAEPSLKNTFLINTDGTVKNNQVTLILNPLSWDYFSYRYVWLPWQTKFGFLADNHGDASSHCRRKATAGAGI